MGQPTTSGTGTDEGVAQRCERGGSPGRPWAGPACEAGGECSARPPGRSNGSSGTCASQRPCWSVVLCWVGEPANSPAAPPPPPGHPDPAALCVARAFGRGHPRAGPPSQMGQPCPSRHRCHRRPSPFLVEGRMPQVRCSHLLGTPDGAPLRCAPPQRERRRSEGASWPLRGRVRGPSVPPAGTPAVRRGELATPWARPRPIRSPSGNAGGPRTQPETQHRDSDASARQGTYVRREQTARITVLPAFYG